MKSIDLPTHRTSAHKGHQRLQILCKKNINAWMYIVIWIISINMDVIRVLLYTRWFSVIDLAFCNIA